MASTFMLRVRRQESPATAPRWEEFEIPLRRGMNVISALMEIQKNPVTRDGKPTTPVAWDCNCLEEVCGACSMVVNGRVRQACAALVEKLSQPVDLAPMTKFPLLRDLVVDRSRMFGNLRKVRAWIDIDGTHNLGPGPRIAESLRAHAYEFSRCMTCGCCLEACPQVNDRSEFMGAAILAQVHLMNQHPSGSLFARERLRQVMGPGGITDCGNAQNCLEVCPKEIPLTDAIGALGRATTVEAIRSWILGE